MANHITHRFEYIVWQNIKQRCYNEKLPIYKYYGGRGITVCDRWLERGTGFQNFIDDVGERPKADKLKDGRSSIYIDRIDNEKGYSSENCRWVTVDKSNANRRGYNERSNKTMRERLGVASELVDDDKFLPMYRNRQIHHEELFDYSVKLAKKKKAPSRYFASIWGKKNLEKSIKWLTQLVNKAKSVAVGLFWKKKNEERQLREEKAANQVGLSKLSALKTSYGLRS